MNKLLSMEDEYESLLPDSTPSQHMIAGACAGVMEHTIVYPVDCVKTRLQCLRPLEGARYAGLIDGLRTLMQTEGIGRSLRGIGAVVAGAGPAHAMYFSCYEQGKRSLLGLGWNERASYLVSAIGATLLHDAIMTPADAVKQRVQMFRSPYSGCIDCLRSVLRSEGVSALYRAYGTQLSMNIPFHMVHFSAYELGQDLLNPQRNYAPHTHVLSGGFAGVCAAACTNPLDVCKTLLNTQERCALQAAGTAASTEIGGPAAAAASSPTQNRVIISSFLSAAKTVYQLEGLSGYFRGVQARVVFQMPGTAISWSVYETFKWYLRQRSANAKQQQSQQT
ncbi:hypothetical protein BOX15_Mlig009775g1 [Macrostomum lignano]|uniref:Uncharacterized protein n=2 Tax=Macrostomum lignano TaxID=282301 RepID=A0A267DX67_9PLAT|nr:hypothetical protein BOX15_Mlig009775g1 [Macrostomum lignano]